MSWEGTQEMLKKSEDLKGMKIFVSVPPQKKRGEAAHLNKAQKRGASQGR